MSNRRHSASNRHQPYGNPSQPSTGPSIPNVLTNPLQHSQGSSNSLSTSSSINVGFESTTNSVNNMEPAISFLDLLSESLRVDTILGSDEFYDSVISETNRQTQLAHQSTISASAQQHSSNIPESIFNNIVLVDTLTPPAFGMVKRIKEDHFGGVYEVSDARGELSVMKVPKSTREPWRVQREVDCLNLVQGSPNVVEFLDEINTPFEKCIRTKICLMNFLQLYQNRNAKRNAITVPESRRFARQILIGLRFIHSTGVIHRGLTMDNVLVDVVDSNVILKIAGFGSAVIAGADITRRIEITSSIASESDADDQQDFKVDVFSFRVIMCRILSCKIPRISHVNYRSPLSNAYFEELSDSKCVQHFLRKALEINPAHRASVVDLWNHCFLIVGHCPKSVPESVLEKAPIYDKTMPTFFEASPYHNHV